MAGTSRIVTTALALFGLLLSSASASSDSLTPEQEKKLSEQIDGIASDLSTYLAKDDNRALLAEQIAQHKYVMALRGFLAVAATKAGDDQGEDLFNLAVKVNEGEDLMKEFGLAVPRFDIKLPVKTHREAVKETREVYVAAVPLTDERETRSVTVFGPGDRQMSLDPKAPPDVPTYVVGPAERESLEPTPPLETSEEPGDEKNPRRVDDYVGVPWIRITDESEGWTCGDPEIYVRLKFWIWNYNMWVFINSKVNLYGVNDAHTWYWLGELGYNSMYRNLLSNDWKYITYEVWEEDSGAHGADDYLGSTVINWKNLPYNGYSQSNFGNGSMMVDRD